jgi:hypothetical protein
MKHTIVALTLFALFTVGCKDKAATPAPKSPAAAGTPAPKSTDDGHGHGHGGAAVELGSTTIGPYSVMASRDAGDLRPGGDAPIDVWVTGDTPKVAAVRFWIGTEDAAGSVKAKADIETGPTHWHTHAELPEPMPAGAQLWVEIEDEKGVKSTGSFPLK